MAWQKPAQHCKAVFLQLKRCYLSHTEGHTHCLSSFNETPSPNKGYSSLESYTSGGYSTFWSLTVSASLITWWLTRTSVQFSCSVVSNSLWPHGLQGARLPCPSPTPGACSDSCPSSQWCHSTISSSVIPFSSCLQSFPASGSFPVSRFSASGGRSTGASASVLPGDYFLGKWDKLKHFHPEDPGRVSPHLTIDFILNSQAKDYLGTINPFSLMRVELVSLV